MPKDHQISMLLLGAAPQGLFLRLLSFFAANQLTFLSMNNLRSILRCFQAGSIRPNQESIKPNQAKSGNFLIITPSPFLAPFELFAANQLKFLSLINLRSIPRCFQAGSIRPNQGSIKPNQAKSGNFLIITPNPFLAPFELFAANQLKFLSLINVRSIPRCFQASTRPNQGSIKPNQAKSGNFLIITPNPFLAPFELFRGKWFFFHPEFFFGNRRKGVYCRREIPHQTGTNGALSDLCSAADRLGGKNLARRASRRRRPGRPTLLICNP
jgi:hypothetical protein